MSRYAIGVDFGTESGRAVLVDVADGTQLATAVYPYSNGVIDERLPLADRDVDAPARLGAPGSRGLPAGLPDRRSRRSSATAASTRPTSSASASTSPPARCCRPRPTARRSRVLPELRAEPARLGQALEAPRRPARGRPDQRDRRAPGRGVAAQVRRQDQLRVVLPQGPPDPRRGARRLRRARTGSSRPPTGSSGS